MNAAISGGEEAVQALMNKYAALKTGAQDLYKAAINVETDGVVAELKVDSDNAAKILTKLNELLKIYTD